MKIYSIELYKVKQYFIHNSKVFDRYYEYLLLLFLAVFKYFLKQVGICICRCFNGFKKYPYRTGLIDLLPAY